MAEKHWHLITYDVRDPKRLRSVAKKLESYGTRIQFSVFRCRLDPEALEKLHLGIASTDGGRRRLAGDSLVLGLCWQDSGTFHGRSIFVVWPATNLPNRLIADVSVGKSKPRVLDVTTSSGGNSPRKRGRLVRE